MALHMTYRLLLLQRRKRMNEWIQLTIPLNFDTIDTNPNRKENDEHQTDDTYWLVLS